MKKLKLLRIILVVVFSLIGALIGNKAGLPVSRYLFSPWIPIPLIRPPEKAVKILGVDIKSNLSNPRGDILYLQTESGKIFFHVNFVPAWEEIDAEIFNKIDRINYVENVEDLEPCPIQLIILRKVIDCERIVFDRPLSEISRFYILFGNGDLIIWIRTHDIFTALITILMCTIIGFFTGSIIGVWLGIKIKCKPFSFNA